MSELVTQLQAVVTELRSKAAAEQEQVKTALTKLSDEVSNLKTRIEELSTAEKPDFSPIFALLDNLSADIEGIHVEPIEPEFELPETPEDPQPTQSQVF